MKTKNRKASKAKRRYQADPSAIYRVMGNLQEFTQQEHDAITMPVRLAFEKLKTGAGKESDFDCLAAACNVSLICSEQINPILEEVCLKARDSLLTTKERKLKTNKLGFDGPSIQNIADMIDIYEQLTKLLKPLQLKNAMREVLKRMSKQFKEIES